MPYLQTPDQFKLPWGGRSPRAQRTSLQGAQRAVCRSGSQKARMLLAYLQCGASTDLQMAARLGLPEGRISARRSGLIERRLVRYVDDVMGPFGAENGRYMLTPHGDTVARELDQAAVA